MKTTATFLQRILCIVFLSLACCGALRAQVDEKSPAEKLAEQRLRARVGLYGDFALNMHSGNFIGIPEAPTCITLDGKSYTGGTGTGFDMGLLFEIPLSTKFSVMARAGYYSMGAK